MKTGLKIREGMSVRLQDIPSVGRTEFQNGDLYVKEFDDPWCTTGCGPRISWHTVIYRPSTNELFRIGCWDGEQGGWFPRIPHGSLPSGVVIVK